MGKPAARIGDMHTCPMFSGSTPHVGGPVTGPAVPNVLIGGQPAAVMGDICTCVGPPDTIVMGSTGVFIGGKPAARQGDMTGHGGIISVGCPTVLIGGTMAGGSVDVISPFNISANSMLHNAIKGLSPEQIVQVAQVMLMKQAAENGSTLVHSPETCSICRAKQNKK